MSAPVLVLAPELAPTLARPSDSGFVSGEGLRLLLVDLAYAGPHAWEYDARARDLMVYTMAKYGALARRYGYEPAEAAIAAFEAMRTRAVRVAQDPWAVVTRAVELTLIYERRAEGLLCSTQQARRESDAARHDAERFSDRETELADYHPAFAVAAPQDSIDFGAERYAATKTTQDDERTDDHDDNDGADSTNAWAAVDDAVAVLIALRWPEDVARTALEYICSRLMRSGNRETAFEALRRDRHVQAMLDLDQRAWLVILRVILGNQHPDRRHTSAGRGMLLRLVIGDQPEDLLADRSLVAQIASVPHPAQGSIPVSWHGETPAGRHG